MMEFILGVLLSPYFFGLLLLLMVIYEHKDAAEGVSFLLVVTLIVGYFIFKPSLFIIGVVVAAWIPIGLLWSIFRWKRHCNKLVNEYNARKPFKDAHIEQMNRMTLDQDISVENNKSALIYWVLVWPVSLVESLVGDIIHMVSELVTKKFREIFEKISNSAKQKIK